ncbi:cytochrome c [Comamonas testosteroni]|uniref:cytochrome c n=1 Tax=Comamonas testosteroni TaxID=285 RepID=UPI00265E186A|nr:cytochrome c [Comamonas testosteroni]WKL14511.1 cytochrome c [Comamonas testosteroni]
MDKSQRSKFTKIAAGIAAAAVVVLGGMYIAGSASGSVPPATVDFANISAEQKQKLFDRGLQVFRAADCAACHSSPTTGAELAGGMAMVTPMGTLYGTNISPSKEHGIGRWSADDLYRAVARGMAPGRKNLYPAMPYASYHDITRADVDALWVWLQAQPAVEVANRQPEMHFPFSIRPGLALWNALERPAGEPAPAANNDLERGAYLVNTLGHCGECHTPRTSSFAMDLKQSLAGNVIEGAYAPDLRPKAMAERGWSERDLLQFLRTGLSPQGVMTMGMFPVLQHSSAHMEEADLKAMAAYLMQGEKPEPRPATEAPETRISANGERVYIGLCAGCHGVDGQGQPHSSLRLDTNTTAMFPTPLNLVRVIREGLPERDLGHGERMQAMPGFADQLSHEDMADLVNYMRLRWGRQKGDVTPAQVADAIKTAGTH